MAAYEPDNNSSGVEQCVANILRPCQTLPKILPSCEWVKFGNFTFRCTLIIVRS